MNKQMLYEYLLFLLSDDKKAVLLLNKANKSIALDVAAIIIHICNILPPYFALPVLQQLEPIVADNEEAQVQLQNVIVHHRQLALWQRCKPWLVVVLSFLILLAMYWYGKA
jgi:hypothetical protein